MSASAEVFISVDITKSKENSAHPEIVEKWLKQVGFPMEGSGYYHHHNSSGDLYEVRGLSVGYEVFDHEWGSGIVKELHSVDPDLVVMVSVYNLDREPDFEYHTSDISGEDRD
jgi:hypothetical protein